MSMAEQPVSSRSIVSVVVIVAGVHAWRSGLCWLRRGSGICCRVVVVLSMSIFGVFFFVFEDVTFVGMLLLLLLLLLLLFLSLLYCGCGCGCGCCGHVVTGPAGV
jgi:hypothetical protein